MEVLHFPPRGNPQTIDVSDPRRISSVMLAFRLKKLKEAMRKLHLKQFWRE